MRTFCRFLTLLLCLEMIVSPIAPNVSIAIRNAHAESCPTGFTFDTTLNRCLTKTETANVMNATMSCGNDKECYKENAKKAFMNNGSAPDAVEDKGVSGFVSKVAMTAAVAGAVTYATMALMKKTSGCKSPAFYGMIGGALALVVGDNLANMQHAKRLKEIQEDWGKVVNPEQANGDKDKERETSIEAQSEAFGMLARAEDSLAKAAKMKQKFFMVASLAFGVTAVISGMEILANKGLKNAAVAASKAAVLQTAAASVTESKPPVLLPPATPSGLIISVVNKAAVDVATAAANKDAFDTSEMQDGDDKAALMKVGNQLKTNADAKVEQGKEKVKITQKMAVASTKAASEAASASTAKSTIEASAQAMSKWEEHTRLTTCEDTGEDVKPAEQGIDTRNLMDSPIRTPRGLQLYQPEGHFAYNQNKQDLYSYYLKPRPANIKAEIQFMYNLKNSKDMSSFVMNKWEMDGVLKNPLDEYDIYKDALNATVPDKSVFEAFKEISIAAVEFMNPISSAHAKELEQESADGGASGGGGGTASTSPNPSNPGVNTNAAKEYKEVTSKGFDYATLITGVVAGGAAAFTGVGKKLLTSKGRLIFSGVLTAMTLLMANHAGSQAEASEKRRDLLLKMKDEFKSAAGAIYSCKSEDRNDPGKPNCYCYTAENQHNSARSNSQICQKLWAGVNTNIAKLNAAASSTRVCVTQSRQSDPTCSCKKNNTCAKVSLNGVSGLNGGTMGVLGNGLAPLNKILDGSIDGAAVNPASLQSNAAKVAALSKALDKYPEIAAAKKSKAALTLQKALENGGASMGGRGLGSSGSSNMPSNPGEAARMLEKELAQPVLPTGVSTNDFIAAPTPAAQDNLEFGMTGDQLAEQEGQIAEVMGKDLDYGGNDINQGSKTNIFEVLSNRYQRSGMRRLFDEKGEAKPEAAANDDITQ